MINGGWATRETLDQRIGAHDAAAARVRAQIEDRTFTAAITGRA